MTPPPDLFDLDYPALEAFFVSLGEKPFRARQWMRWAYKLGVLDPAAMTEFSGALRQKVAERARFVLPRVVERQVSRDGTVKLLLELADGERVETVLIPDEERLTQCVSTQVGCAMGCAFCRTAEGGFTRHLTAGEIIAQVFLASYAPEGLGMRVTNVVFMGMGEPLHNVDNVVRAYHILEDSHGLCLARRRLTVSTCGLVDVMRTLPVEVVGSLAISLNATTDAVRDQLMPVNRRYNIATLIGALRTMELPPRGRFTIEYVLLGGVNDSEEDARRLAKLLAGVRCMINLIPFNPHGASPFARPAPEAVERFQKILWQKDYTVVLRRSRGDDILAACGQLRAEAEAGNP